MDFEDAESLDNKALKKSSQMQDATQVTAKLWPRSLTAWPQDDLDLRMSSLQTEQTEFGHGKPGQRQKQEKKPNPFVHQSRAYINWREDRERVVAAGALWDPCSEPRARSFLAEGHCSVPAREQRVACSVGEDALGACPRLSPRHPWCREEYLHTLGAPLLRSLLRLGGWSPVPVSGNPEHDGSADWRTHCSRMGHDSCEHG